MDVIAPSRPSDYAPTNVAESAFGTVYACFDSKRPIQEPINLDIRSSVLENFSGINRCVCMSIRFLWTRLMGNSHSQLFLLIGIAALASPVLASVYAVVFLCFALRCISKPGRPCFSPCIRFGTARLRRNRFFLRPTIWDQVGVFFYLRRQSLWSGRIFHWRADRRSSCDFFCRRFDGIFATRSIADDRELAPVSFCNFRECVSLTDALASWVSAFGPKRTSYSAFASRRQIHGCCGCKKATALWE